MILLIIILVALVSVFGIGTAIINKEETEWKKQQRLQNLRKMK